MSIKNKNIQIIFNLCKFTINSVKYICLFVVHYHEITITKILNVISFKIFKFIFKIINKNIYIKVIKLKII